MTLILFVIAVLFCWALVHGGTRDNDLFEGCL